jgi:hypothetical protein
MLEEVIEDIRKDMQIATAALLRLNEHLSAKNAEHDLAVLRAYAAGIRPMTREDQARHAEVWAKGEEARKAHGIEDPSLLTRVHRAESELVRTREVVRVAKALVEVLPSQDKRTISARLRELVETLERCP